MYDDDLFNILNSMNSTTTTTESEQENTTSSSFGPQTYNPYSSVDDDPYSDDYSVRPNYEEQRSYNSVNQNYSVNSEQDEQKTYIVNQMATPTIKKDEPTVNLIKKRQRIELQARMKIMISMFAVIVAALIFAIVWNFVSVGKMEATFAGKQQEITALQESIMGLRNEYTSLSDDEQIKNKAESEGYVDQTSENTIKLDLEEIYDEHVIADLPSNWFNDVCDFLSGIFS